MELVHLDTLHHGSLQGFYPVPLGKGDKPNRLDTFGNIRQHFSIILSIDHNELHKLMLMTFDVHNNLVNKHATAFIIKHDEIRN